ncbi:MAG: hypothetical protein RIS35_3275 [Pseudomonadota bacterium]|jgi:membrane fusion protein (multidrug efflux system)
MKRIGIVAAALAGVGVLGWWGYGTQREGPKPALEIGAPGGAQAPSSQPRPVADASKPASQPPARGPIGVEAVAVVRMPLSDEVLAVGTLRANESVVIKPEIAGRIVRIGFQDGARVPKAALLVALDDSVLAAQADQARAELGLARASYERTEDLAKKNFVSGSARDQAQATLRIQEAKLQLAEAQLAKTRISAPFAGVLGLRNVSVGDFVKDGAELVVLEDVGSMKVDLRLPERFLGQLRRGQSISVSVDAFPGRNFAATLDALDAQVDANGRSLLARGRLANPDGALRTGMFAKARIVLREKPEALVVPEEAILPVGSVAFVYKVEAGKAVRTEVRTGLRTGGKVEIVSGLQAGDVVVTAGHQKLTRDGADVRVIDPPATARPKG